MQYAQPLSCEARIRTSSRRPGRCRPGRAPWWRRCRGADIARENAGTALSKSSRTGDAAVVVMPPPLAARIGPRSKVQFHAGIMGQFWARPAPRPGRDARRGPGWSGALREAVRSGRLRAGHPAAVVPGAGRRPGDRPQHGRRAYGQLVAEGWLTARQGSGTGWPSGPRRRRARRRRRRAGPARPRYDLRPASPDLSAFPPAGLAGGRPAGAGRGAGGRVRLRRPARPARAARALADYLARARGVPPTPERIVVCAGFAQALGAALRGAAGRRRADAGDRGLGPAGHTARSSPPAGCGWRPCRWTSAGAVPAADRGRRGCC